MLSVSLVAGAYRHEHGHPVTVFFCREYFPIAQRRNLAPWLTLRDWYDLISQANDAPSRVDTKGVH